MRFITGILNLIGYCILALFFLGAGLISLAVFFASLFVPVLFLWEWDFFGEEKLRIAETFVISDNVYQQMVEVTFSPDRNSQTVIAELKNPSRSFLTNPQIFQKLNMGPSELIWHKITGIFSDEYASTDSALFSIEMTRKHIRAIAEGSAPLKLSEYEKVVIKNAEIRNKHASIIAPELPKPTETLFNLEDCTVENSDNWVCMSALPFIKGKHQSVSNFEGQLVIELASSNRGYPESQIYKGKIKWWLDKQKCSSICSLGTIEQIEQRNAEIRAKASEMLKQIISENETDD